MSKKHFHLTVIPERCKDCGICIAFCPQKILRAGADGKPELTDPDACSGCKQCEYYCPDFAIYVDKETQGPAEENQEKRP